MSRYSLPLEGYDDASIWGHDGPDGYFAQLWRNDHADEDEPDVRLNWFTDNKAIQSAPELALHIAVVTGFPVDDVAASMAEAQDAAEHAVLLQMARHSARPSS